MVMGKRFIKWTTAQEILLINMIESNPFMWNRHHPLYRKHEQREGCLKEISSVLGPGFTDHMVKKKWRILRDQYIRLVKKMSEACVHPKWNHFKRLRFLGNLGLPSDPNQSDQTDNSIDDDQMPSPLTKMEEDTADRHDMSVLTQPSVLNESPSMITLAIYPTDMSEPPSNMALLSYQSGVKEEPFIVKKPSCQTKPEPPASKKTVPAHSPSADKPSVEIKPIPYPSNVKKPFGKAINISYSSTEVASSSYSSDEASHAAYPSIEPSTEITVMPEVSFSDMSSSSPMPAFKRKAANVGIETFIPPRQVHVSASRVAPEMDAETEAFVTFVGINLMKIPQRSTFMAHMEIMEVLKKYLPSSEL